MFEKQTAKRKDFFARELCGKSSFSVRGSLLVKILSPPAPARIPVASPFYLFARIFRLLAGRKPLVSQDLADSEAR